MDKRSSILLKSDGGKIHLRPYRMEDAEAIFEAVDASRSELSPWMDWCTEDYSLQDTVKWLAMHPKAWKRKEIYGFAVIDPANGAFLGGCGLNHILWDYKLANLGYWVRSDRTGEGLATQAAVAVARFGLKELGLRRIEIVAAVENRASRRVAEKAGAKFEGILRHRIKIGDRHLDAAMHSLILSDFQG